MSTLYDAVASYVLGAPGVGNITTGAAVPGARTPTDAAIPDGTVCPCRAESGADGSTWEVGDYTWRTAGHWERTLIRESSAGGSAVPLGSDTVVFITPNKSNFRLVLDSNVDYFVSTTGNNNNDGSIGFPWATIQHAVDFLFSSVDMRGYKVTINIADGTYNEDVVIHGYAVGQRSSDSLIFRGNLTTPSNVVINASSYAFEVSDGAITLEGMKFTGGGIGAFQGARISGTADSLEFGDVGGNIHMDAEDIAVINVSSPYTISGGAWVHAYCYGGSLGIGAAGTITITGTPHFSHSFVKADAIGNLYAAALTFSGSATGKRYEVDANSVVNTAGGGATYFPGNAAGTSSTGGQYI